MKDHVLAESVGVDERRRVAQHEQVKEQVRENVHRELHQHATHETREDQKHVESLARELKQQAVREVSATESGLARARTVARVSQVVDYVFYVLYGSIGLLIVLELLGARESSGFKQFMNAVTAPVVTPFKGLVPDPAVGSFQLMLSYVIGLFVYVLLHLAINGALRLLVTRKTAV